MRTNICNGGGGHYKKLIKYFVLMTIVTLVIIGALVGTSFSLFTYNAPGRKVNTIVTGGINLDESGANEPELLSNMIPVYYDETNNVWKKADEKNMNRSHKWYDYNNKMWANAVTTAEEGYTIGTTENDKVVNINNLTSSIKSYTSSNKGIDDSTSSSVFTFTAGSNGTYSFDWSISSQSGCDKLTITINGTTLTDINAISGINSGTYTGTAINGTTYTIIASYVKDSSDSKYDDIATIGNFVLPSGSTEITHTAYSSHPNYQWKDTPYTANSIPSSKSYKIENGKFVLDELSTGSLVNKYMCSDGVSVSCDKLYFIKEATDNMVSKVDSYSNIKISQVRNDYLNAPVGTVIEMDNISTMWVWIPRFKATGDPANYNGRSLEAPGAFNISFVNNKTTAHDAFKFGTQELNGFWMGKFETSHTTLASSTTNNNLGCTTNTCNNANGIIIKPDVVSLRYNNISNFFYGILSMKKNNNSFGFDITKDPTLDTHMIKNSEWGAVAYLTQSIYGRCSSSTNCTEVYNNNNGRQYTGRSGGYSDASPAVGKTYKYNENTTKECLVDGTGTNIIPTVINDNTYPWKNTNGIYSSSNNGKENTTATLIFQFKLRSKGILSFDYSVSSPKKYYDLLKYKINNGTTNIVMYAIGGISRGTTEENLTFDNKTHMLEAGTYSLTFEYSKVTPSVGEPTSIIDVLGGPIKSNFLIDVYDGPVESIFLADSSGLDKGYVKNVKVVEGIEIIDKEVPAGQLASTTGNIYGVYDMNGGTVEFVMGVYTDGTKQWSGYESNDNSGFTGCLGKGCSSIYSGIAYPNSKYYNSYTNTGTYDSPVTNYNNSMQHALVETADWYSNSDSAKFVYGDFPWFRRGGGYAGYTSSGLFNYGGHSGSSSVSYGSRAILVK